MNCKTCNGLGVIPVQTGQTAETYGEYNIDCPDCGCGAARMCSAENGPSFGAHNLCREKGGEI